MAENPRKRHRRVDVDGNDVLQEARDIWSRSEARSIATEEEEFRGFFGCPLWVFVTIWHMLEEDQLLPEDGRIQHMLWALMFLKIYSSVRSLCALAGGVDKNTFMKWVWQFIEAIEALEDRVVSPHPRCVTCFVYHSGSLFLLQIIWTNRYAQDKGNDCLVSCDGADFRIPNHGPRFSSHKYNKRSALRYEICLCILTGDIVWINGPCECGIWPDISIFRDCLMDELDENEMVEADDGYIGEHPFHIKCPAGFANPEETEFMQQRVRNRQESVNNRWKFFACMKQVWRHDATRHGSAFRAIGVILQVTINSGEKLFSCGYRDPPYNGDEPMEDGDEDDENDL